MTNEQQQLVSVPLDGDTQTSDLINLTPHTVVVAGLSVPPSGQVARVAATPERVCWLRNGQNPIEVVKTSYGEVEGLPAPSLGAFYIVSTLVRLAVPERTDVFSPSGLERDAEGKVTGCKALEGN